MLSARQNVVKLDATPLRYAAYYQPSLAFDIVKLLTGRQTLYDIIQRRLIL